MKTIRTLKIDNLKATGFEDIRDYLVKHGLRPTDTGHFVDAQGYFISFNHVKCMIRIDKDKQSVKKLEKFCMAILMAYFDQDIKAGNKLRLVGKGESLKYLKDVLNPEVDEFDEKDVLKNVDIINREMEKAK